MTRWLCALILVLGCVVAAGCNEEDSKASPPVDPPAGDAKSLEA